MNCAPEGSRGDQSGHEFWMKRVRSQRRRGEKICMCILNMHELCTNGEMLNTSVRTRPDVWPQLNISRSICLNCTPFFKSKLTASRKTALELLSSRSIHLVQNTKHRIDGWDSQISTRLFVYSQRSDAALNIIVPLTQQEIKDVLSSMHVFHSSSRNR